MTGRRIRICLGTLYSEVHFRGVVVDIRRSIIRVPSLLLQRQIL